MRNPEPSGSTVSRAVSESTDQVKSSAVSSSVVEVNHDPALVGRLRALIGRCPEGNCDDKGTISYGHSVQDCCGNTINGECRGDCSIQRCEVEYQLCQWCDERDDVLAEVRRLSQPAGEPVAFRWRFKNGMNRLWTGWIDLADLPHHVSHDDDSVEVEYAYAGPAAQGADPCLWTQDADGSWDTECGNKWEFIDGSPADNDCVFCVYCGKKIAQSSYLDDETAEPPESRDAMGGKSAKEGGR